MAARAPMKLGRKEVFLPNFTLTLLRTPHLPPSFAQFIVPLHLNKLDLRDYLWNCYGVRVHGVRSYIQQQKLRQDKEGAIRPRRGAWHRPRAIKKMLVELDRPFVWPPELDDYDSFDKKTYDGARKEQEETQKRDPRDPNSRRLATPERVSIAEQAKALLEGKEVWKPRTQNEAQKWEDDGHAVEVETNVLVPRT